MSTGRYLDHLTATLEIFRTDPAQSRNPVWEAILWKDSQTVVTVAIIGGAAAVVYGYISKNNDTGPGFTLIDAERGDITEKALAVGEIDPRDQFQVKSKISGIVSRCFRRSGRPGGYR